MSLAVDVGLMEETELDRALLESMDETLTEVFSTEFREAFYRHLETTSHIMREGVPNQLNDFVSVLSKIFGSKGSLVLERAIAKRLYSKLGIGFIEKPGHTLLDYFRESKLR